MHSKDRADATQGAGGIAVRNIRFAYAQSEAEVLAGIDLSCADGEIMALVGPSGCGKSTLLSLIAGLHEQTSGEVEVTAVHEPEARLSVCAHMPQGDSLLPWFNAVDNAAIGLRNRGARRAAARRRAATYFHRFGLAGAESALPNELSGGMRQRVAFLRTLLAGKPVLLLDEPFGALDAITRSHMQRWLASTLNAEPRTTLLVTHDVEEALYLGDQVTVLSRRPAKVLGTLRSPQTRGIERSDVITDPAFVQARKRAIDLLEEGAP